MIATTVWAEEYWVFTRLEDRSGLRAEDDAGRSKRGDIVVISPVIEGQKPTKREQEEYLIFKADLTKAQVEEMRKPYIEERTFKESITIKKKDFEDKEMRQDIYEDRRMKKIDSIKLHKENGVEYYEITGDIGYDHTIAYRKNKLDLTTLGISEKGLNAEKVAPNKIEYSPKTQIDLDRYAWKQKMFAFGHPIRVAWNVYTRGLAYAAATTSKICAVGDNCTDEDYNTLGAWEDAVDGVLDGIQTAECYDDDGTITEANFVIDGSTTDSTNYIKITAPAGERHDTATGGFTITSATSNDGCIAVADPYSLIEWVHCDNWAATDWSGSFGIHGDVNNTTLRYNLLTGGDQQSANNRAKGIYVGQNAGQMYRNIVKDLNGQNSTLCWAFSHGYEDEQYEIHNNVSINNEAGFACPHTDRDAHASNNIAMDNKGVDWRDCNCYSTGTDKNMDSDGTACGTTVYNSETSSDIFVSNTTDFHLKAGSNAIDAGDDMGSPYDVDIDGTTVTGTWDIGADEYVSAPAGRTRRFF